MPMCLRPRSDWRCDKDKERKKWVGSADEIFFTPVRIDPNERERERERPSHSLLKCILSYTGWKEREREKPVRAFQFPTQEEIAAHAIKVKTGHEAERERERCLSDSSSSLDDRPPLNHGQSGQNGVERETGFAEWRVRQRRRLLQGILMGREKAFFVWCTSFSPANYFGLPCRFFAPKNARHIAPGWLDGWLYYSSPFGQTRFPLFSLSLSFHGVVKRRKNFTRGRRRSRREINDCAERCAPRAEAAFALDRDSSRPPLCSTVEYG